MTDKKLKQSLYTEFIDRIDVVRAMIEEILLKHHVGDNYQKDIDLIDDRLCELYNKVSNDSDELFKEK